MLNYCIFIRFFRINKSKKNEEIKEEPKIQENIEEIIQNDLIQNLPVMHPEFQRQLHEYSKKKGLTKEEDIILPKILKEFPGYESLFQPSQILFMIFITASISKFAHPLWLGVFVIGELIYY